MSRVVVTGGAGFIGAHLVRALVARRDDVLVLDNLYRPSPLNLPVGVSLIEADIREPRTIRGAFEGVETVYHLAAQSNVLGAVSDPDYSFATNVAGTYNVLQAARAAGVGRVVFSSSREVYGEPACLPVSEAAPLLPKNSYGASKVAGEAYARVLTDSGMAVSILRLSNVYGPGDRDRVIPLWISRAALKTPLEVFGGQQVMDFVPVTVAVEALLRAADRAIDGPVNVGSGIATPIGELARRISSLAGGDVDVVTLPARGPEVVQFVADTRLMRGCLGVEPPGDPLCGLADLWRVEQRRIPGPNPTAV